ncbi:MAG: NADP-dependent oxidoreductase protein [Ramlibacter sp.]|jgi:aryl-alcohol dehydrogenase-like predicted oxidoreductase|uniref:aldo/keto reductase n=1 Tax=Ramlibacter sp. TaxID=1917967 RepID=UPI0026377BE1|nr:aldo/keto reductase [Ramlibacter sp.]MDB5752775.1 NADP-dependent oxidoreductase protein [Ramlibacter sp.]
MNQRSLGRSALLVSPLCFGGNVFGWTADERTSFSLLDAWVDAGFNFIDTADVYSRWVPGHAGGESEAIIGKWLAASGRRDQVVLATKVGMDMGDGRIGLKPARIREAVEASLRRLQTDRIDLYQAHKDDAETPLEQTLEAFARLVEQGKVRVIGASNYGAARLREALDVSARLGLPRYESLQPLYNLYDRAEFEAQLAPLCRSEGLAVINFYALAAGFLTGKYRTEADAAKSARGTATVGKYLNERGLRIVAALDEVAQRLHCQPGQVAIAWLLARPGVTSPIASASSLEQLAQLAAAARLQLDPDDLAVLDAASSGG